MEKKNLALSTQRPALSNHSTKFMPQYFGKLPTTDQAWTIIGEVKAFQQHDKTIIFECGKSKFSINILAANLVRVRLVPHGEFTSRRPWALRGNREQGTLNREIPIIKIRGFKNGRLFSCAPLH